MDTQSTKYKKVCEFNRTNTPCYVEENFVNRRLNKLKPSETVCFLKILVKFKAQAFRLSESTFRSSIEGDKDCNAEFHKIFKKHQSV